MSVTFVCFRRDLRLLNGRPPWLAANDVKSQSPSPRLPPAPLSVRDLPPLTLSSVPEAKSGASSPLSAALSPTDSDVAPASATVPDKAQNPIIRRAISCSSLTAGEVKQRRKRSRVNPEQLVKLEEFFAADNSPTSARRKEIAQLLGMDERQTQIWFQNRCVSRLLPFGSTDRLAKTSEGQTATENQVARCREARATTREPA